jgi:hypothetical protein
VIDFQDAGIITTVLTAGGAPIWAGIIQGIIQVLKAVPQFKGVLDGREKLACFLLAILTVVLGFMAALQSEPPSASLDIIGIVGAVLAVFTLARLAMAFWDDFGAKDDGNRPTESVLHPRGWTGK